MATSTTESPERDDTERSTTDETSAEESAGGLRARALAQVKNGRLPMVAGGLLAVRGLRDLLSDGRGGLGKTAAGLALLGVGLRQRSKRRSGSTFGASGGGDPEASLPGVETVSIRSQANEPGTNPRDVDDEPHAASEAPDEGSVQFETENSDEPEHKPHLDTEDPIDPRYPDEGDPETDEDHVDVDISEDALADEPNEAVGPDEEQAFPAAEGTDPEPSSAKAPERTGEGAVAHPDAGDESTGDEEQTTNDEQGLDEEPGDESAGDDEMADAGEDEARGTSEASADDDSDESDDEDIEESV